MRLYIVQHAKAYPKDIDPDRRITDEGRVETEDVAKFLLSKNVKIDKIYHSTKLRARMTAEIFSKILNIGDVEETEGLAPLDDPSIWADKINDMSGSDVNIMIIGHLPHLSKLTTLLLNVDREVVKISYSSVLCLNNENGRWIIEWYITPELAR